MLADGKEPRFDRDYDYGRQAELAIDDLLTRLARGQARLEVKRKSKPDAWFYVETEHNPFGRRWQPSGASTSEAEAWVFVVADTGVEVLVPFSLIRRALDRGLGTFKECKQGDCPTRGRLLHIEHLLRCDQ
jgi:hypothetical protein